jgi:hypothetical protein
LNRLPHPSLSVAALSIKKRPPQANSGGAQTDGFEYVGSSSDTSIDHHLETRVINELGMVLAKFCQDIDRSGGAARRRKEGREAGRKRGGKGKRREEEDDRED